MEKQNEKAVIKEIRAIARKNGLKIDYTISFPIYRKLPDDVKLALSVIAKHKMKITLSLNPISKG